MTTTTTTAVKVDGWQRGAAGVLFAAALVAILANAWLLFVSALSFGASGSAFTVGLRESPATEINGGGAETTAYFIQGIFSSIDIGFWPQAWMSIARILWSLVWLTVALCVLVFSYGAYHGEVFSRRLPRLLMVAAVAVGAAGTLANVAQMWGTSTAMAELLSEHGTLGIDAWNTSTDPTWTILTGLLLALLAIVFRSGQRLQRDTEGLV